MPPTQDLIHRRRARAIMFKLFYEQWVKEYDPEHNQCFYRNTCVVVEGRAESASRN